MAANITLDRVGSDKAFEFSHLHETCEDSSDYTSQLSIVNTCAYFTSSEFIESAPKHSSQFSVFSLNCRSLPAHWADIKDLVANMSRPDFFFDVIGLTEVFRLRDNVSYCLDGYHDIISRTRGERDDGRGGVGLFIKDKHTYLQRDDLSVFIPHVFESVFVELVVPKKKNIIVGCIYRPNTPPLADMDIFTCHLLDIVDIVNTENKTLFLCGDFNIDLLSYNHHEKTKAFTDDLYSRGISPLITKPTRVTDHSATIIDHIYTNLGKSDFKSGIIITDVADHFGVFTITGGPCNVQPDQKKGYRCFSDSAITNFREMLRDIDFSSVLIKSSANDAYNILLELYKTSFDTAFPLKTSNILNKYVKRDPWLTTGLLVSSIKMNKLLKLKLRKPTDVYINKYKDYRRLFNKLKRCAKSNYYKDKLNFYRNDIKSTWRILSDVIKRSKRKNCLPSYFFVNNQLTCNKTEIAAEFNKFFVKIGKSVSDSMMTPNTNFRRHLKQHHPLNFFLSPVVPADLLNTAAKLKTKLSEGYDNISNKILKETIEDIAVPLCHVFNLSFSTGIVPDQMKIAKIIPIFKNDNPQLLNNYRPISILPAFSKLLEKIVYRRLYSFINSNDIFYEHQYGFRPKHATVHPVIQLIKDTVLANDKRTKDFTIATFLDLSKAFDTVSHDILLTKLNHYGVRGISNDWFKSYLTNRFQFTQIDDIKSSLEMTVCGVPQGSILGPLLFLLYVNDIGQASPLKILSFADDTTILASASNINDSINTVNTELANLYTWLCENRLSLNINKTNCLIISPPGKQIDPNITVIINQQNVTRITKNSTHNGVKFLGIYLDEHLCWNKHADHICNKLSRTIFAMNMAKHSLPTSALITLYYALVESQISYGISIWGNSSVLPRIAKLQKQAIRVVYKLPYRAHCDPLFKRNNTLKIRELYELNIALLGFDYRKGLLPKSFIRFYPDYNPPTITRQAENIYSKTPRTTFSKLSVYHMIPHIWNNLPRDLQIEPSRTRFKNTCKLKYLDSYASLVNCHNVYCKQCNPIRD